MHPTRALRSINWPVLVSNVRFAYRVTRGSGIDGHHDGLIYKNVLAGYTHLHALGAPGWAEGFVKAARLHKRRLGHPFLHNAERVANGAVALPLSKVTE